MNYKLSTHLFVFFISIIVSSCSGVSVDKSICSDYRVDYNKTKHYYLVSHHNTPSSSFYIWEAGDGFYLLKTITSSKDYYEYGPYKTINQAIRNEEAYPVFNEYTWDHFEKEGDKLVTKEDGTSLTNLCN